ncbi:MAG: sulfatase-like hydrolase/transferase [Gammaproteobacteria bacterium]|nr:sulfatase-like hydrolase/transferase [Gammaproteobacteria bacterium]
MSGCASNAVAPKPKAVFIIVDGIPADVLESTSTPVLDAISEIGGYARAYVGGTPGEASESPTSSAIGYNNLLTGTWANKHNVYDNQVDNPNYDYWDIFRIAKTHDPSLQTALFSTWTDNRTKLLGDGLEAAGGDKIDYAFDGFELDEERFPHDPMANYIRNIDEHVTNESARYIESFGPDLSWVYLEYTDSVGHGYGDGPVMIAAVEFMDTQIGRIWNAVQKRQRDNQDEDWLIIITTDHGRDAETGQGHGNQTQRERTTWIVTNSDDLNPHFNEIPGIVDILPSIAAHLDLEIPANIQDQLDGQSFID